MRTFCIVPEKMPDEPLVKVDRIEQFGLVEVDVFLLDGAIEPFIVRVHLRTPWIGVPVDFMEFPDLGVEVLHKLGSVVRQDVRQREREDVSYEIEEFLGRLRGMACRSPGEREPRINIRKRNDIPAGTMDELLYRVKRAAVSRVQSDESLWFPLFPLRFSHGDMAVMPHLGREYSKSAHVLDEIADRGDGRARQTVGRTEGLQENEYLFFPKVWMF